MYILFDKRTDLGRSLSSLGLFDLNIIAGFEKIKSAVKRCQNTNKN